MVGRRRVALLAAGPMTLTLAGCTSSPAGAADPAPTPTPAHPPRPAGPARSAAVPSQPMGPSRAPIARRLARQARADGLRLDYLACPSWDGRMPHRLACTGWFDGVRATVLVRLRSLPAGSVGFDAEIGPGVVATRTLVGELRGHGYASVDCGERPAYPARPGLRIVCAVSEHGPRKYVVATVRDRSG